MNKETNEQIEAVRNLRQLQISIQGTTDRQQIAKYIYQALHAVDRVSPCIEGGLRDCETKWNNKRLFTAQLERDASAILNGEYYDMEMAHFQSASSLQILMMLFIEGGETAIKRVTEDIK